MSNVSKILIATIPGSGHVNPMLSVAKELVHRGHEVRWYTGKVFQQKIESIGVTYEPMQRAFDHGGMAIEKAFPQLQGLTGLRAISWERFHPRSPKSRRTSSMQA